MRSNARIRTPASITIKVDPEKRDWMQAYALHLEVSGESLIRRRIAKYVVEAGLGLLSPFNGSRRPVSTSQTVSFKLRLDAGVRDAFVTACETNRTTPSIVIRSMIDDVTREAISSPDRAVIEEFKREKAVAENPSSQVQALPAPKAKSVPAETVKRYFGSMLAELKGKPVPAPVQIQGAAFEEEEGLEEEIDESTFTDTPPDQCSPTYYEAWLKWKARQ